MAVFNEIVNHFQVHTRIEGDGERFAFYLLKNGEILVRSRYGRSREHTFGLDGPGVYRVKGYRRLANNRIESELSVPFRFEGFSEEPQPLAEPAIAIAGVSRMSAFAGEVFGRGNEVRCYVDPTGRYVGESFFGLPVVSDPPEGARLIGPEGYLSSIPNLEPISLRPGAVNALTQEFHRYGAMTLHRISRAAFLGGMERGAHALEMFILDKYSTRLSYRSVIGEGTALGVGGMGIAIHADSVIGRDCVIAQNVTLGSRQGGNGTPVIGDNVYIGPGANCLGGRIGNNVVVGAGAVVLNELPDNCVAAGVPAKIISRDVSRYRVYTHRSLVKGGGG